MASTQVALYQQLSEIRALIGACVLTDNNLPNPLLQTLFRMQSLASTSPYSLRNALGAKTSVK